MPISPKEIADKRIENTVTKLCDLIDRKLQESEDTPFEFTFLANTSPEAQNSIVDIYRKIGWSAALIKKSEGVLSTLVLQHPNDALKQALEAETPKSNLLSPPSSVVSFINDRPAQSIKGREAKDRLKNQSMTGNEVKDKLIAEALSCDEGHFALAVNIAEPINHRLAATSPMRKLFIVDNLPNDAKPTYDTRFDTHPIYHSKDGTIKSYDENDENCLEDITELKAHVEIPNERLLKRQFYVVDDAQCRLSDSLESQEACVMMKLLQAAAVFDQTIYTYGETTQRAILDSIGEIESGDMIAAKLIIHPKTYRRVMFHKMYSGDMEEATMRDVLMTGLYGHIYTLDIHVSTHVPENEMFITPMASFLGAYALPSNVEVLPCKAKDKLGFLAKIQCFPVIMNPQSVRKIVIRW
jgi:hypothetical protein